MTVSVTSLRRFIVSAADGPFGSALKGEHYSDSGARVIRLGNVGAASWRDGDRAFISLPYWSVLERHQATAGDLIVAGLGDEGHPVGRACVLPDIGPAVVKADCFRLRVDTRSADPRFLAWYLCSTPGLAASSTMAEGSTRQRLTLGKALALQVPLVELSGQRAIADYLDTETVRIDRLIAKKRHMLELLEERFRALIESEQAPFTRLPLKRCVRYIEGPGIMAADFQNDGVPLIRVAGVGEEEVSLAGCNFLDPDVVRRRWSHFQLLEGDYLISASASMGTVSRVGPNAAGAVPYTGLIIFRPIARTDMEYVRFFLRSPEFIRQIDLLKTGTAIQHFGPTHLDQVFIPLPTDPDQQRCIGKKLRRHARRAIKHHESWAVRSTYWPSVGRR